MTEVDLLRKAVTMHGDKIKKPEDELARAFRLIEQLQRAGK